MTAKHYLDPSRPRISGLPAFAPDNAAHGLSIIPALYCAPRGAPDANVIEVSGFFSSGPNTSSRKEIKIPLADFPAFWDRWLADPEGVAEREFGWVPLAAQPIKSPPAAIDLDDLLGDF
jgi:hypothetical protein